jgi:DNA (cytosine-5)-methyltransferase 1
MTYRTICSGIEAPTVAWAPLGWKALSFAEIEPFCCSLLKFRYPEVLNYGDFTKIQAEGLESTDLLMGGTPCQSFSIAGKRAGLDDPRGNLALEFIRLAQRLRPRWLVWENVQGVLSSDEGRTFEAFLGALAQVGYGFAYRVLDAQFDALAQRRERVFVVGYLGDWRPPAAVLFERESLRRDTAPGRKAGEEVAGTIAGGSTERGYRNDLDGHEAYAYHETSPALKATGPGGGRVGDSRGQDAVVAYGGNNTTGPIDVATACRSKGGTGHGDFESETFVLHGAQITSKTNRSQPAEQSPTLNGDPRLMVAHTLSADGFDASEDGTGRGSPLVVETLRSHPRPGSNSLGTITGTLSGGSGGGSPDPSRLNSYASHGAAVRRLTPREWERLMGFEDDYTLIPYPRLKLAADGPRYKAIGNSISVPTLRWIGRRIQTVDDILRASPSTNRAAR